MKKEDLAQIAHEIRSDVVKMYYRVGWGHLASSLSCVDILTVLYWGGIVNTDKLFTEQHDRVILSKGHACAALYAILARWGYFPRDDLATFYQKGSSLVGLASNGVNGIDIPTGSLGHGICFATGTALAGKLAQHENRTYVILGDGESQEGSVWEAALFAGAQGLYNLTVILDYNGLQGGDWIDAVEPIMPIRDKWESFGWLVLETDGHDYGNLMESLGIAKNSKEKPVLIIAKTIKGKGISMIENRPECHSCTPQGEEWKIVCQEMGMALGELKRI